MTDPVACPHCGKGLKPLAHLVGQPVVCPACRESFTLSPAPAPAPQPAPPPPRPEPLPDDALTTAPGPSPLLTPRAAPPTHPDTSGTPAVGPFRLRFQARVVRDPGGELAGLYDATLNDAGLRLQNDEQDVLLERGLPARHEGDNRIVVRLDGRELELALERKGWATDRLAPDVAAFLNREVRLLHESDYCTPLTLCLVALLPAGIPFVTAGGLAWGTLAAVLVGLCLALLLRDSLSRPVRLAGCLALTAAGYLAIFLFHPLLAWGPGSIEASAWRTFAPEGASFEVELPGQPQQGGGEPHGWQTFWVQRDGENLTFEVTYHPLPRELAAIGIEQVLAQTQEALLDRSDQTRRVRRHLLQGRPALDLEYDAAGKGKGKRRWVRAVGALDGVITLTVYGPRKTRYEKDIRRFLDSVRLRPAAEAP